MPENNTATSPLDWYLTCSSISQLHGASLTGAWRLASGASGAGRCWHTLVCFVWMRMDGCRARRSAELETRRRNLGAASAAERSTLLGRSADNSDDEGEEKGRARIVDCVACRWPRADAECRGALCGGGAEVGRHGNGGNGDFVSRQLLRQKSELETQDAHLDELYETVKRISATSKKISDELVAQNQYVCADWAVDAIALRRARAPPCACCLLLRRQRKCARCFVPLPCGDGHAACQSRNRPCHRRCDGDADGGMCVAVSVEPPTVCVCTRRPCFFGCCAEAGSASPPIARHCAVCFSPSPCALHRVFTTHIGCGGRILTDLDEDIDGAVTGMSIATKRTQEFIEKHGGVRWCCIVMVLLALLCFLVFLILFT